MRLLILEQEKQLQKKSEQIVMLHESDLQLQKARLLEEKYKHALLLLDQERARITNDRMDT